MIKPWLFEFFRAPTEKGVLIQSPRAGVTPADVADEFASFWAMWTRAEGYGFEGIFFSEHHFGPGYSPSPNLLIAALAPVTSKLRLGVMGMVLPYYQPWRVIEEIGMLDHLTRGRLEVGTAAGIPPEMAKVGLGVVEANERNLEALEILDWALAHPGEPVTHHGKYWDFENLTLVPMPSQRPSPNRWTTVVSEASARRAAWRGTRICTGFSSVEQVQKVFGGYREEAGKAGLAVSEDLLGLRRIIMVDRDGDKARDLAAQVEEQVRNMFLKHDDKVNHGPVPDAPQKSHGGIPLSSDEFIAGSPVEVADLIAAQCEATGAGHLLAMLDNHGGPAENRVAFDLFGQEVVPLLRQANVGGEGRHALEATNEQV
ncbi:LLM class flavin-dependent oxidoreductase (plasmid) [Paraburkholderia sprentiae WSM5005]|uniref:LLM class flavin-dependent oxidoreductase n=1 Tax=Paraburkholderia sprentiae WSM5005 TaxID=754502 RepID=A0A1I9YWF1_9BURK|nr:LLM class flavin-dependent oxidoreductase [Paraburkholderia sprentiae]APA90555.1 LLM class flavin-dependent oxidoreductase [Paraburkholderia sprentiae WSM5005]